LDLRDQHPDRLLGLALDARFIPNVRERRGAARPGRLRIVSLGLAATMFGFENIGRGVLPGFAIAALVAVGLILLALYARRSRSVATPILDLSLLRVRTFGASVVGGFVFRMGIGALPFLTPLMLQLGFGLVAFLGHVTSRGAAGALLMKTQPRRSCAGSASGAC
jgi:hypothetical protein